MKLCDTIVELSPTATPMTTLARNRVYKLHTSPNNKPTKAMRSVTIMDYFRLRRSSIGPAKKAPKAAPIGSKAKVYKCLTCQ